MPELEETPDVDDAVDDTQDEGQGKDEDKGKEQGKDQPEGESKTGFDALPKATQTEIRKLRAEAQKHRVAAGKAGDDARKALLADLTKLITGSDGQEMTVDQARAKLEEVTSSHSQAVTELAVHKAAARHGGDPEALLDSRAFLARVKELDPTSPDYAAQIAEHIKAAIAENPRLAAGTPTSRSGGEIKGGTGEKDAGSWAEIEKAAVAGRRRY